MTKNTWRHGRLAANVCRILGRYVDSHPEWSLAIGDPGTKLSHDPDTLRGPDVGLVRAEREPTGSGESGWLEGAPELVVEVQGDSQSQSQLSRKALEFLKAGAQLVWVLDDQSRELVIYTPPDRVRVVGSTELLDGGTLLPGFSCRVADLFA